MKQNRTFIASLIACLLAVACLFQLAALNERTTSMERNMSTWMNNMDHRISNISFSVQDTLEEQASLLADSRWEYGDADIPSQTAVLRCAVTPKEFSPAETTASLICGEQAWPMTLENGEFVARITLPLFSDSVVTKVLFSENGTVRTEPLNWNFSPRSEFLPVISGHFSSSGTYGMEENVFFCRWWGVAHIDVNNQRPCEIRSISLIEMLDGNEVKRTKMDPAQQVEILSEDGASPEAAVPVSVSAAENVNGYQDYNYEISGEAQVPKGSTYALYAEVTDGYGLHYRVLLERWTVNDAGERVDDEDEWMWRGAEANIYDEHGAPLYETDYAHA